ncbi:uncharacterized protein BYT42DRAFT_594173 [Radiomyces spectabilis]|uniref:uncharacterized protein n=1 Tax=Radiomyces spectabilis TaxID=64574 RepID=UPI00221EE22B|nr:uncharacterized protein BYT42DRAFT_594173 [Radiomyces spectabilis]KAI8376128.1 hypothetical protein BYT42DRAFT_594173 [Radiomyces spectabilis]
MILLKRLPLELLLKVSSYLSFDDVWYLATVSRHGRSIAHQIIWHKYNIDLTRPRLNAFNHLVHSAIAYLLRYGYVHDHIHQATLQSVANRLAVEIYDRTPLQNWEPCLDFYLDKTLGLILDHVMVPVGYCSKRMGQLLTQFLSTLYPTLTALFETGPASSIHHRLLVNHLNRHLDSLTILYHHQAQHQLLSSRCPKLTSSARILNQSVRRNVRRLVHFAGTLVQTDLLTPSDLALMAHHHIVEFFTKQRLHTLKADRALHEKHRLYREEIDFQITILLDLVRAILYRQSKKQDSEKELRLFSNLLTDIITKVYQ